MLQQTFPQRKSSAPGNLLAVNDYAPAHVRGPPVRWTGSAMGTDRDGIEHVGCGAGSRVNAGLGAVRLRKEPPSYELQSFNGAVLYAGCHGRGRDDMQRLALARHAPEADAAGRGVDGLGVAGGRAVAPAKVGRAQARAALEDFAGNAALGLAGIRARTRRPPRGFLGTQQGLPASAVWWASNQSLVHSQTLPIML